MFQFGGRKRLAEKTVHASGYIGLAVFMQHVRGDGNDVGLFCERAHCAYGACGLHAIHLRHLHVHQNNIVGLSLNGFSGFASIASHIGTPAHAFKHQGRETQVDGIVFCQQQTHGAQVNACIHARAIAHECFAARRAALLREYGDQGVKQLRLPQWFRHPCCKQRIGAD